MMGALQCWKFPIAKAQPCDSSLGVFSPLPVRCIQPFCNTTTESLEGTLVGFLCAKLTTLPWPIYCPSVPVCSVLSKKYRTLAYPAFITCSWLMLYAFQISLCLWKGFPWRKMKSNTCCRKGFSAFPLAVSSTNYRALAELRRHRLAHKWEYFWWICTSWHFCDTAYF